VIAYGARSARTTIEIELRCVLHRLSFVALGGRQHRAGERSKPSSVGVRKRMSTTRHAASLLSKCAVASNFRRTRFGLDDEIAVILPLLATGKALRRGSDHLQAAQSSPDRLLTFCRPAVTPTAMKGRGAGYRQSVESEHRSAKPPRSGLTPQKTNLANRFPVLSPSFMLASGHATRAGCYEEPSCGLGDADQPPRVLTRCPAQRHVVIRPHPSSTANCTLRQTTFNDRSQRIAMADRRT